MEKLVLIDGNHLIHRAFWAIKAKLVSPSGEPTNATYGFTSMLINIINIEKPNYIAIAFDEAEPTFRHKEYDGYKKTRIKAPDELYQQIPRIRKVTQTFSIPDLSREGFEADDILGALAKQAENEKDLKIVIVTGDQDAFQLIDQKITVAVPHRGYHEPIYWDEEKLKKDFELSPAQIIDFKGLAGDASDNLKGCPGIGEKGAMKLIKEYGNIENIYEHIDEIKGAMKKKLELGKESVLQCKRLARLRTDAPIKLELDKCHLSLDYNKIEALFDELGFRTMKSRLRSAWEPPKKTPEKKKNEQMAMF